MRAVLKKLSNARVPVLPVLGLVLLWSALWAAVALAESIQEKQYESLQAAGADCDTVAAGCHYMVLGGLTTGNVITRIQTDADGVPQVQDSLKTVITTFQLNCGSPATQLTATAARSVTITALAANTAAVYIGASGVDATTGHEIVQSSSYSDDVDNANRFYCFSTAGTMDISVMVTR